MSRLKRGREKDLPRETERRQRETERRQREDREKTERDLWERLTTPSDNCHRSSGEVVDADDDLFAISQ